MGGVARLPFGQRRFLKALAGTRCTSTQTSMQTVQYQSRSRRGEERPTASGEITPRHGPFGVAVFCKLVFIRSVGSHPFADFRACSFFLKVLQEKIVSRIDACLGTLSTKWRGEGDFPVVRKGNYRNSKRMSNPNCETWNIYSSRAGRKLASTAKPLRNTSGNVLIYFIVGVLK